MVPLGAQVRLPPPPPQGTQTRSHSHPRIDAQKRVLTPAGGAQGSSDPKAHAGTRGEAAGSSASLFFLSILYE